MLRCSKNIATSQEAIIDGRFTTRHGNHGIYKADPVVEFIRCIYMIFGLLDRSGLDCEEWEQG